MNKIRFVSIPLFLSLVACSDLGEGTFEVPLSYLDGESNFGSQDGTGTAVIESETGGVDIEVHNLPALSGEVYEGWLAGGLETAVSTGRFNTDGNGDGMSSIVLGNISMDNFTKVVLTVEPEPDSDPGPDSRHSLAGEIPKD